MTPKRGGLIKDHMKEVQMEVNTLCRRQRLRNCLFRRVQGICSFLIFHDAYLPIFLLMQQNLMLAENRKKKTKNYKHHLKWINS